MLLAVVACKTVNSRAKDVMQKF